MQAAGEDAMNTFIMMTRLNSEAATSLKNLEKLEKHAVKRISKDCPSVEWVGSYAAMGPCHYIDIFKADSLETATKAAALIRTLGHAQSEVWPVIEWSDFKQLIHGRSRKA
jgi:uncharacterized protein with GYD domain